MKINIKVLLVTISLLIIGCNVKNNEIIPLNNNLINLNEINFDKCTGIVRRDILLTLEKHHGKIDKICLIEKVSGAVYKFKTGEIRLIEFSNLDSKKHNHHSYKTIIKNEILN